MFTKILILGVILFITPVSAQNTDQQGFGDRPAQYILGGEDMLLITVNLWGHIQRPGIYTIPIAYGLIDLISSAGGPLTSARLSDVRIIRNNQGVIKVDVEKFIKLGDFSVLPILQPGDTIVVSGSVANIFANIIGIIRDIAIIANAIYLVSRIE